MPDDRPPPVTIDDVAFDRHHIYRERLGTDGESTADAGLHRGVDRLRSNLSAEIVAMAYYATSSGIKEPVEPVAGEVLDRLVAGEPPSTTALLGAHHSLKALIAPATPVGVLVYHQMRDSGGRQRLLGPHATIRRLSLANLVFLVLFFATSLTTMINSETIHLSVYEQSGAPLLFKLVFITAVSGIGASFSVLFEAWEDIKKSRFDPIMESSYWLQIGLGVMAGVVLTEIVQTGGVGSEPTSTAEPLVALAGGFSAGLLHMVLSRVVNAIRNIFEPAQTG
jgi:hypothetical protein